jgi:ABC-type maltose transport system permease subunit
MISFLKEARLITTDRDKGSAVLTAIAEAIRKNGGKLVTSHCIIHLATNCQVSRSMKASLSAATNMALSPTEDSYEHYKKIFQTAVAREMPGKMPSHVKAEEAEAIAEKLDGLKEHFAFVQLRQMGLELLHRQTNTNSSERRGAVTRNSSRGMGLISGILYNLEMISKEKVEAMKTIEAMVKKNQSICTKVLNWMRESVSESKNSWVSTVMDVSSDSLVISGIYHMLFILFIFLLTSPSCIIIR